MALSGCRNSPPSEKLSGVTFSTPITSVRSPSTSFCVRNCSVNFFLELIRANRKNAKSSVLPCVDEGSSTSHLVTRCQSRSKSRIGLPAGLQRSFVRKYGAENGINRQLCLAARARNVQVLAGTVSHELILLPLAARCKGVRGQKSVATGNFALPG